MTHEQPAVLGKPGPVLRAAFKLPQGLYRLQLGWLLGHRFLQLTHCGRTSGRIYQTVLEVVRFDRATRESVVVAGFGARSDWYRNLRAHPALEVRTGRTRYVPAQRFLTSEEGYAALTAYERRYGLLARAGLGLLYHYDGSEAGRRALAEALPMVAFRPRDPTKAADG